MQTPDQNHTKKLAQKILDENTSFESLRLSFTPVWNVESEIIAKAGDNIDTASFVGERFPFPYRPEDADKFKEYSKSVFGLGTEYNFAAKDKNGNFVGCIGFKVDKENSKIIPNIGYWLSVDAQGQGYATEMLTRTLDFIKDNFPEVGTVKASAAIDNPASCRVLEKAGFLKTGEEIKEGLRRNGSPESTFLFELKIK